LETSEVTADVVGDARLDLTGAGAGEERQGHALQAPVDGRAQVVHHALAHGGGDQRLEHPEDAAEHRADDHAEHQQAEQAGALLRQGDVEDLAQQERARHRDERGGADQDGDDSEAAAVGAEEAQDAAHLPGSVRVGRRWRPVDAVGTHGLLRGRADRRTLPSAIVAEQRARHSNVRCRA
jgi:hypothetical protein